MGFADATGDGCPEFFVQTIRREGLYITCLDWHAKNASEPLFKRGPFFPNQKQLKSFSIGNADVIGAVDADGDSAKEVFIGLNCNYFGPYCRSLLVCRPGLAKDLWRYDMGPVLTGGDFLSIPNDTPLVVVSTFAPFNGTSCNGTTDSQAYVFCFKGYNRLLWKTRTSGVFTWNKVRLADIDGDGRNEVIVARKFEDDEHKLKRVEDLWSVAVLDRSDGHIVRHAELGAGVAGIVAADLDGDNLPEIIVSAQDGKLYILDNKLKLIHTSPDARQNIIGDGVVDVRDLNNDGKKEIICQGATEILIRDNGGRLIAEKDIATSPIVAVATSEGRRYIVAKGAEMSVVRIYELVKEAKVLGRGPWLFAIMGILVGFIGTYTFNLSRAHASKRSSSLALSDEAHDSLLVGLSAFEHGGSSLAILRRLQFRLVNWDRRKDLENDGPDEFEGLVESFRTTVVVDLRQIMILARRAKVPRKTPKSLFELATSASGSLETLMAVKDSGASEDQSKNAAAALSILQEIDKGVSALRKHLRTVFRAQVAESVGRALNGNLAALHAMGIEPKLHVTDTFDDAAFVSPLLFEKVLNNLISNAIAAMEHGEGRSLEVFLHSEGAYLLIDVKDGGPGIRRGDWERIFERAVTTKEEGGFGLHFSREGLAKFGAKIFVLESAPDGGTTFRIILRKA